MSDEDEINIDTKVQTIQRYEVPTNDHSKNPLKRHESSTTENNNYSPKKKRLLEHINTEYSSGGGVLSGGEILSPSYKTESYSPQQGLLSPNPEAEPPEQTLLGGSRSDPDWVHSHVSEHGEHNRAKSDEGDQLLKVEQGGNKSAGGTGYSEAALKMMRGMGYEKGAGLGKEGQGITEPIQASVQKGSRGLGHYIDGFQSTTEDWKERPISTTVTVEWMSKPTVELDENYFKSPPIQQLIGPRKNTIEDETRFVSTELLLGIQKAKAIFDQLPEKDLRDSRTRSNPFESISSVIFQNRAAMKMAEVDALSGWAFTQKNKNYENMATPIYFGDICAGPGGFSEYILWRTQWHAKGFGLTLRNAPEASDFKMNKFLVGPGECFEPYYGVGGAEGDGDILKPENLEEFKDYVMQQTGGLNFVMGDGGISVAGQENIQEILTKQLLLCQFACALSVLRQDGNFLCKTFDLYTPFSVGLVHLLRYAFEKVAVIKPLTSRPANSERYVLCLGCKRKVAVLLYEYLFKLNMEIRKLADSDRDIQHVVPLSHYITDSEFCRYMTRSNDSIGDNQLYHLRKLKHYVRNPGLSVTNQNDIREICLKKWEVPNEMRKRRLRERPMETAERLLNSTLFRGFPADLNQDNVGGFSSRYSWKCHLRYGKPVLLLGQGTKHVFFFNGDLHTWTRDQHMQIELPRDTIVEAQVAEVFSGENSGMRTYNVVITDGIVIGGQEIYHKPYSERIGLVEKMCKTTRKESATKWQEAMSIKSLLYRLEHFNQLTSSLRVEYFKGHSTPRLAHCVDDQKLLVQGIIFVRHIKEPWNMELSTKLKKFYFFNCKTRSSQYEWPADAAADFGYTRLSSLHWTWDPRIWNQILQEAPITDKLLEAFLARVNPNKLKNT